MLGLLRLPHLATAAEVAPAAGATTSDGAVRWCMVLVLVSATLLARFGINFGSYSLDFSLIALYALFFALLYSRRATVDTRITLLYALGTVAACASLLANAGLAQFDRSSPSSLLLLIALYLPFVVTVTETDARRPEWAWVIAAFGNIAMICAVAGIAQFYAQFVVQPAWLFDFTPLIPTWLRGPSGYNTVIEVGAFYKSNGFFLREPSSFSFVVALATILELMTRRRWARIGLFAFALLLTYSGTGVLALIIGLVFPPSRKSVTRLLLLAGAGVLLFWVLGDALNLSFTTSRIDEFGSERSSAYIRYIAPMRVLAESFHSSPWSALLGHGPGTIQRTAQRIEFFDPTWAKLLFEYGLLGCGTFLALVLKALHRSGVPAQLSATLFFSWLVMGGHLLSPENISSLYVLACVWRSKSATHRSVDEAGAVSTSSPFATTVRG